MNRHDVQQQLQFRALAKFSVTSKMCVRTDTFQSFTISGQMISFTSPYPPPTPISPSVKIVDFSVFLQQHSFSPQQIKHIYFNEEDH